MAVSPSQRMLSVLIVDETLEGGSLLSAELQQEPGIRIVATTTSTASATELFLSFRPEIVLASICLPEGSGFGVLDRVKRVDPRCDVILMTRQLNPFVADTARLLGAVEVCAISHGSSQIRELLRRLLADRARGESGRDGIST